MEQPKSCLLRLPPDVRLDYLAEGGANIVYRIVTQTNPSAYEGYLLRLHKEVSWIPSYAKLHEAQTTNINTLFEPSQLVFQSLILVPRCIIRTCNTNLRLGECVTTEATPKNQHAFLFRRPQNRHGLYLAEDETHGLLVGDMTANANARNLSFELKPKWLLQSPNAPPQSTRCRTCALRALRLHKRALSNHLTAKQSPNSHAHLCPLDLVSNDPASVSRAVAAILAHQNPHPACLAPEQSRFASELTDYLLLSPLLARLRTLQASLDPDGILALPAGAVPTADFLIATTLRDCTLFLRIARAGGDRGQMNGDGWSGEMVGGIEARLGDLDVKVPGEGKLAQWKETERELGEGGWYLGRGELAGGTCWLERTERFR